jgi:hypothetical protein
MPADRDEWRAPMGAEIDPHISQAGEFLDYMSG